MIYSNLREKLLFSPELKFRLLVPNQGECNTSVVLTPTEEKESIHKMHAWLSMSP